MAGNGVHTVPAGDSGWVNEVDGTKVGGTHPTKDEAVEAGREEAKRRQTEHHIHNLDGTIGEKNSYGNDPRNIPG